MTADNPHYADCDLDPNGPRRGEHHFAVRFGDLPVNVYKDGAKIHDCYEVDVLAGKAWRYKFSPDQHLVRYIDKGDFSVSTKSDEP
jgi:hypothetical protein